MAAGNEYIHKIVIFGGSGLLVLSQVFSLLIPKASHSLPDKSFVVEQYRALPPEDRTATNPAPNWFERHFCLGFETSKNCEYQSSLHPSLRAPDDSHFSTGP